MAKKSPPQTSMTKSQAEQALREGAEKVKPSDVEKVLKKSSEIEKEFERGGPLGQFVDDLQLLISLVRDYWGRRYREIPYLSIAATVAALLYVLNPMDIIPDVIPLVGQVDDVHR